MKFLLKYVLVLSTTLFLISCSIAPETKKYTDVVFECSRGTTISVRFYEHQELALLTYQNQIIELPQVPTASGFLYTNMKTSIRGKGNDLTLTIGRMIPLMCVAQN